MAKTKKAAAMDDVLDEVDLDALNPIVKLPPLVDVREDGYVSPHVEARLDPDQAQTLRRLFDTLDEGGQRLKNGRRIASNADVVRWLLEAVADAKSPADMSAEEDSDDDQ